MDFALLPPEVNSGRMYSGAGAGPLLAAAASWDALAAELQTMGAVYESVLAELSGGWSGPSATAMATAAAPYAKWIHTTSAQAEQAAIQAKAAVAAYETAFAMTVPPPVVEANRAQLMALLATNFLGQNTPAIAATEAHYAEMWAQDAAAMYGYAHGAAAASRLTPFTEPPQTTNPARPAGQSGAVGQAGQAGQVTAAVTHGLQGLQSLHSLLLPTAATPSQGAPALLTALAPVTAAMGPVAILAFGGAEVIIDLIGSFAVDVLGTFLIDVLGIAEIETGLLPIEGLVSSVTPAAAGMGEAVLLSGLSVPQAWTVAAATVIQPAGRSFPAAAAAGAAAVPAIDTAAPFAGMAAAGLAGRATAAIGGGGRDRAGTTDRRRPAPSQPGQPEQLPPLCPAKRQRLPFALLVGVDIELRELAELRAASVLTEEEYAEQKRRLLGG